MAAAISILAVGRVVGGQVHLNVAPPLIKTDAQLAAVAYGRRLFVDGAARSACISVEECAGWDEANAEVEALIDEMHSKPNLGIVDAPPFIDYDAELEDQIEGRLDAEWHARGMW